MRQFPNIIKKFPDISDETIALIANVFAHTHSNETLNEHPSSALFEQWFLETFQTDADIVQWLLELDPKTFGGSSH